MAGEIQQYVGTVDDRGVRYEVYKRGTLLELAHAGKPGTIYHGDTDQSNYNFRSLTLFHAVRELLESKQLVPKQRPQ